MKLDKKRITPTDLFSLETARVTIFTHHHIDQLVGKQHDFMRPNRMTEACSLLRGLTFADAQDTVKELDGNGPVIATPDNVHTDTGAWKGVLRRWERRSS